MMLPPLTNIINTSMDVRRNSSVIFSCNLTNDPNFSSSDLIKSIACNHPHFFLYGISALDVPACDFICHVFDTATLGLQAVNFTLEVEKNNQIQFYSATLNLNIQDSYIQSVHYVQNPPTFSVSYSPSLNVSNLSNKKIYLDVFPNSLTSDLFQAATTWTYNLNSQITASFSNYFANNFLFFHQYNAANILSYVHVGSYQPSPPPQTNQISKNFSVYYQNAEKNAELIFVKDDNVIFPDDLFELVEIKIKGGYYENDPLQKIVGHDFLEIKVRTKQTQFLAFHSLKEAILKIDNQFVFRGHWQRYQRHGLFDYVLTYANKLEKLKEIKLKNAINQFLKQNELEKRFVQDAYYVSDLTNPILPRSFFGIFAHDDGVQNSQFLFANKFRSFMSLKYFIDIVATLLDCSTSALNLSYSEAIEIRKRGTNYNDVDSCNVYVRTIRQDLYNFYLRYCYLFGPYSSAVEQNDEEIIGAPCETLFDSLKKVAKDFQLFIFYDHAEDKIKVRCLQAFFNEGLYDISAGDVVEFSSEEPANDSGNLVVECLLGKETKDAVFFDITTTRINVDYNDRKIPFTTDQKFFYSLSTTDNPRSVAEIWEYVLNQWALVGNFYYNRLNEKQYKAKGDRYSVPFAGFHYKAAGLNTFYQYQLPSSGQHLDAKIKALLVFPNSSPVYIPYEPSSFPNDDNVPFPAYYIRYSQNCILDQVAEYKENPSIYSGFRTFANNFYENANIFKQSSRKINVVVKGIYDNRKLFKFEGEIWHSIEYMQDFQLNQTTLTLVNLNKLQYLA